jgi:hypothetical protein
MATKVAVTIGSPELGLHIGTIADLDRAVALLNKEQLIRRIVTVLHALHADRPKGYQFVNGTFLASLLGEKRDRLRGALASGDTVFIEPWQQLLVLRRAMARAGADDGVDVNSALGLESYFEACRYAADSLVPACLVPDDAPDATAWLHIASGLLPRLWLTTPLSPNEWIARQRITLDRLPNQDRALEPCAAELIARFPTAVGLSHGDLLLLVAMLSYGSLKPTLEELFSSSSPIAFSPETWLSKTDIPLENLRRLLERASRNWDELIPDNAYGGPTSILVFRDRPIVRFSDGAFAPVMRELAIEKLGSDIFWWTKSDAASEQDDPWQRCWGRLFEAYCLVVLRRIAGATGCGFLAPVSWGGDLEMDAAMWFKGHVALFEITCSSLRDADAHSLDPDRLRSAVSRSFVEANSSGKTKLEAVGQLARDVTSATSGGMQQSNPVLPTKLQRVYPVMIAADRRTRTPGLWHQLGSELSTRIGASGAPCSALAVLGIEDLDHAEQLTADNLSVFRGTPPGLLRLLRRWDLERGPVAPSWWQFVDVLGLRARPNQVLAAESRRWLEETRPRFVAEPAVGPTSVSNPRVVLA